MTTVIDSLVITLALDPTKYTEGQKEALKSLEATKDKAKDSAVEMERSGVQAASFFDRISDSVLGLAASFIGLRAVTGTIVDITNSTRQLGQAAQVTGEDLQKLAAFGQAVARNGGNSHTAVGQVSGLVQSIQSAKLGQVDPNLMRFLGYIGAGVNDDPIEILKKFADFAKSNESNPALVSRVGAFGGITDTATLSELMKGSSGLQADLNRVNQIGLPTKRDVEAANDLTSAFHDLTQSVETASRDLITAWEPALARFIRWLTPSNGSVANDRFYRDPKTGQIIDQYGDPSLTNDAGKVIPIRPEASDKLSSALDTIKRLERSDAGAVSSKGAVGEYQITRDTANTYGLDYERLKRDPAYNKYGASVILSDLLKKYNGDMDAVAVAYHSGPGAANAYLARGRDPNVLGPQGRDYLAREQRMNSSTVNINGPITVQTQARDIPTGTTQGVKQALQNSGLSVQANTGLQ